MKYFYFIEIEGVKHYKADTFWSKTEKLTHAKMYVSGNQLSLLESFAQGFNFWLESNPDSYMENYKKYNNGLLGYSEFKGEIADSSKPLNTYYLLKFNINEKAEYTFTDYKKVIPEEKINEILDDV